MTALLDLLPSAKSADGSSVSKVKQSELVLFTSQLSVMLSSGVVLSEAVESIASQTQSGVFQDILFDISERLQGGENFSSALSGYPKIFNPMFVGVVQASEASGKMPEMLEVLQKYLEGEMETRKQIKGAMVYPVLMMVMSVLATTILLFFILPKFTGIYESRGRALPRITQMLVGFSEIMSDFRSVSIIFTGLVIIAGGIYYALTTRWGKRTVDWLKINSPVIGVMFTDTIMTRSTRILATMLNAGVTLFEALQIVRNACGNFYFNRFWQETSDRVESGFQFSEAMKFAANSEMVSPVVIQMIKAGEKSGDIGEVCSKISDFYDKKLKSTIKNVTSL
ncbi:MAG: type II secretion system F family protein, partial [Phycisphaerae bacterium]|nr:type II secretion system F family protein [Phycisphaerae bacterium]